MPTGSDAVTIGTATANVNMNVAGTFGTLTLSGSGDALTILSGEVLTADGNITNAGTITLNPTAELVLGANVTLSGGGTVTLSNNANNVIQGAATTDTLTNQETIQGAGQIGNGQMTLVNSGIINSNQSVGLTIQANGGTTNTGTLEATGGSTLALVGMTVTNSGGTISANRGTLQLIGATVNGGAVTLTGVSALQMNNSTIHGGSTLTNSAMGTIEVANGSNTLGGTINNSAGGTFKIDNGAILNLEAGTYSQLGTVQLNSTANVTELVVGTAGGQNVTLSGGTVTLSNNANNVIQGAATTDTLTNQETIQGAGQIGNGQMTLVNSGIINSNQSAGMTIQANGGTTNTGTLEATGGSTLALVGMTVTNSGGTISANGSTLQMIGATINGGAVTLTGASALQLNNSTIHGGSTLTNSATGTIEVANGSNTLGGTINNSAGGTFKIDNGAILNLEAGTYSQLGTVQLNSTGNTTELGLLGNVTLSGGTLTLSNNANNFIFIATSTNSTLTNQETIQGAGQIGNGEMALVNSGTINANQSAGLTIQVGQGVTNTGTLEATAGSTLTLAGPSTLVANSGGTISANGGTLQMIGSTINGGAVTLAGASTLQLSTGTIHEGSTLTNSATGTIEVASGTNTLGGTINNSAGGTLKIDNGAILNLEAGTYSQLGTVQLNSTGNSTELQLQGNVTLSGGTVTLSNNINNFIQGSATANTLTNQETIQGAGNIGNGQMTLVNSGTINANQSAGMTIQVSGGVTNTGTLEATAGSTLALVGTSTVVANTGGTISATGGTLQLTGETINGGAVTLTGASALQMNNSAIHGGSTLTNSATGTIEVASGTNTLGGTINNSAGGTLKIDNGATLNLEAGNYSQLGTVQLNSTANVTELVIEGNVTLSGGTLTLSNNANNFIFGAVGTEVLTNQETISGAGQLGFGSMGLVNSGTINANASADLLINVSSSHFRNTGTIEATGGTLTIQGPGTTFFTNDNQTTGTLAGGTYIANGNNIQWNAGSSGIKTLSANVTEENGGQLFNTTNSTNALMGLTSITSTGALTIGGVPFTDTGSFSNAGSLTILTGESFTVGTLAQISGGSLTAGIYVLDANLNLSGATQNITTNAANLTLAGGTIENANSTNALAALASNTKSLTIAGTSNNVSTTAASFSNTGTLTINAGDSFSAPALTQISGSTLSGGTFVLAGNLDLTTSGISITTNSSTLTLEGGTINSNGVNALSALASNTKSLTIAGTGNNLSTTAASFSNTGTLTINAGDSYTAPALTQISGSTLSGGVFVLAGNLDLTASGLSITKNAAALTLEGGTINSNGVNALSALATNTGKLTIAGAGISVSTSAASFSNSGSLIINNGDSFTAAKLNQISGTTLTAGTYVLGGNLDLTSAANITTNSATLTLEGGTIQTGSTNDLANLNSNTKSLTLASNASFTAPGSFSNSGTVTVAKGTTFAVGGTGNSYNQTAGTTTVDGTLSGGAGGAVNVTGGTILGAGSISANTSVGNASGATGTINIGDTGKSGLLAITGTYTQLATGNMTGLINGTTAGTGFSQINMTGAAALAGTINFTVATAFQASLTAGETFTVLNASSVTGTFSNSTIAINSSFHFVVSYTSTGVVLTVTAGAAVPNGSQAKPTAQVAMVSPKRAAATTNITTNSKTPVVVSGRQHSIGGADKSARPILVASWPPRTGHSDIVVARGPEMIGPAITTTSGLRSWEHMPVPSTSQARPLVVVGSGPRAVNADTPQAILPTSDLRMGQSQTIRVQAPVAGWIGASRNQRVPLKMMQPMPPRITR